MSEAQDCYFQYLPTNDDTASTPVDVIGAGRFVSSPGKKYPPAGHPPLYHFEWRNGRTLPEFQVLLITNCQWGEFESESTGILHLEDTTLIILSPGIWHRYRPLPQGGWTERWLSFSGEISYKLFDHGFSESPIIVTRPRDAERLVNNFDDLLNTIQESPATNQALLSLMALRIVVESAACRLEEGKTHDVPSDGKQIEDSIVREALKIIWSQSHVPMSVVDVSRQLPITRRALDQRFSAAMGHSVLEEINSCRRSRARRLLEATDLPVKTVAYLAGFPSAERMRVAFVEREQVPPLKYRRTYSMK